MPRARKPADPASDGGVGKRSPLNLRTSTELRAKIERAAHESGLSLTQEVERRLIASFEQDETLGGGETAMLFRSLANMVAQVERRTGRAWSSDPVTFAVMFDMISDAIFQAMPMSVEVEAWGDALERRSEARKRVESAVDYLTDIGVLSAAKNAHLEGEFVSEDLYNEVAEAFARSHDERDTSAQAFIRRNLWARGYLVDVDLHSPPEMWHLQKDGQELSDREKIAASVELDRLEALLLDAAQAEIDVNEAYAPNLEAIREGRLIAKRMREEARAKLERGKDQSQWPGSLRS